MKMIFSLAGFLLVALFMLNGCNMIDMADIVNDDVEIFVNKQKFDIKNIEQYKINDVVIAPLFISENEKDVFTLLFASFTNKRPEYVILHSYEMDITGPFGEKHFSETLDEKLFYESQKGWSKNTYSTDKTLLDEVQLPVGNGSKISVKVDVTVKSAEKEERKKILIEYYYKKYK